ncbi:MAG: DUF547 domain-containing protein, partial [Planctomycetales bacterium]
MRETRAMCAGLTAAVFLLASDARAGEEWNVGRNVASARCVSMDQINHGAWDRLLKKHVDSQGYVNYRDWHASAADRQALDSYLKVLSTASASKSATSSAKIAFWINAYNAVTIKGILREYPTTTIRNHTAKLWGYNIWHDLKLWVGGGRYSLDQMEHKILRKMGEPRIHFAIVCASISCPKLLNEAYEPRRLDSQLT